MMFIYAVMFAASQSFLFPHRPSNQPDGVLPRQLQLPRFSVFLMAPLRHLHPVDSSGDPACDAEWVIE
jgi:hypothetical protein